MHWDVVDQPLSWRRPQTVFVNSMSDLAHPRVTDEFIAAVFAVMGLADRHRYQVLTKRPRRLRGLLRTDEFRGLVAERPWRSAKAIRSWSRRCAKAIRPYGRSAACGLV